MKKNPLAIIEASDRDVVCTNGICCLPRGDVCVGFKNQMKIFDSSGRFLFAFGSDGPAVCYLDRWHAPSSATSSLFLIGGGAPTISIWDANHLQHIKY